MAKGGSTVTAPKAGEGVIIGGVCANGCAVAVQDIHGGGIVIHHFGLAVKTAAVIHGGKFDNVGVIHKNTSLNIVKSSGKGGFTPP